MIHDPLCEWWGKQCEISGCDGQRQYSDICEHDYCQCILISMVRDEERWATVESAVFVASQYGCDHGLLNALNAIRGDA